MKETYHYDEQEDTLTINKTEDISSVLDANKAQFDVDNKRYTSEAFNHVARIPVIAIEMWCKAKGIPYQDFMADYDNKLMKQFLNDPDNKYFRTKPGRI